MKKDPRHNRPSCSGLYRLENCQGSWKAEQGQPDQSSDDACSGTRIHEALEKWQDTDILAALTVDEQDTAYRCREQLHEVLDAWQGVEEPTDDWLVEKRLGMTTIGGGIEVNKETTARLMITGQADVIARSGNRAIVIDYKTGRGETQPADSNAQLRGLAVLVALWYRSKGITLDSVRVAIVAPWQGPPTVADFDAETLKAAQKWLATVVLTAEVSENLYAGDWCKYCKVRAICPALLASAQKPLETLAMHLSDDPETLQAAATARAMDLPAKELIALKLGALKRLEMIANGVEAAIRMRAESDPSMAEFVKIVPGSEVREIVDANAAWGLAESNGVTHEQFMEVIKVGVGDFATTLRLASGPKLLKDGTPAKSGFALSDKAAKQLIDTLAESGALVKKRQADKLEFLDTQLEAV